MQHKRDERGQAYALEGIIGAVIVVSALVLGLQAVDIAPWTAFSERASDETRTEVADGLDAAADSEALRIAVTCVEADGSLHPNAASTSGEEQTEFGAVLADTFDGDHQYRIDVDYFNETGEVGTTQMGPDRSPPSQQTVTVSRTLVLSDSDPIHDGPACEPRGEDDLDRTLADDDEFYIPQQDEDSDFYAVVRVRVIAW